MTQSYCQVEIALAEWRILATRGKYCDLVLCQGFARGAVTLAELADHLST